MIITPSAAAATEASSVEGERGNLLVRDDVEVIEERAGVTVRDNEDDGERFGGGGLFPSADFKSTVSYLLLVSEGANLCAVEENDKKETVLRPPPP